MRKRASVPATIESIEAQLRTTVRTIYIERAKQMLMLAAKRVGRIDVSELLTCADEILKNVKPKATAKEVGYKIELLRYKQETFKLSELVKEIRTITEPTAILHCAEHIRSKIKGSVLFTPEGVIDLNNFELQAHQKRLSDWVCRCREAQEEQWRGDLASQIKRSLEENPLLTVYDIGVTQSELSDWIKQGEQTKALYELNTARAFANGTQIPLPGTFSEISKCIEHIRTCLTLAGATLETIGTSEHELKEIERMIHARIASFHLNRIQKEPSTAQSFIIDQIIQPACKNLAHTVRNEKDLGSAKRKLRAALRHWMPLPKKQNTTPNV